MSGKDWKITDFPEAVGCKTKTSFPLICRYEKRSQTHFTANENSSALFSAMLDKRMTELTNHSQACSILAGLAVIGPKMQ